MKKIISLLLSLCLALALFGCKEEKPKFRQDLPTTPTEATEPQASTITPLLYEVTDGEGHTIWLFGSIHVGRKSFYPLPDYIWDAFDKAEALAVEFDIRAYEKNKEAAQQDMLLLAYTDGTQIQDHISPELYASALELLKGTLPEPLLRLYKPALWSTLIEASVFETGTISAQYGIDTHMIDAAYERNMPVLSIESASEQYGMLGSFSDPLQEFLLQEAVTGVTTGQLQLGTTRLVKLWSEGDEAAFTEYLSSSGELPEELPEEYKAMYEALEDYYQEMAPYIAEYEKAMITDRNLKMTDYAETRLKEGKPTMICVGAAHVVGPGAMAELLRSRGYTVTKLSPTN